MAQRPLRSNFFDKHSHHPHHLSRLHPSPQVHRSSSHDQASTSRPPSQLHAFKPVAQELISIYGAFYNRSRDILAARRWEALRAQGFKPEKRSPLEVRWWQEERRRGRIQPDHQISRPILFQHPSHHLRTIVNRRSFSSTRNPDQNISSGPSQLPSMIRKDSPDIMNLVGGAADFGTLDLDYGGLDSDSFESGTRISSLGKNPGTRGLAGLRPGSFIELRRTNQSETGIVVSLVGSEVIYVGRSGEVRRNSLDNVMYIMHHIVVESMATQAVDPELSLEGLANPILTVSSPVSFSESMLDQKASKLAEARKHCCRALRVIDARLDRCHSILTKAGSYNLYNQFKHPDRRMTSQLSTEKALEFLLGKQHARDELMSFALHQQLMENSDVFIANAREMRDQSTFTLQSEETVQALYTVQGWVAHDSSELKKFVKKAQEVIQTHQALRNSADSLLPLRPAPQVSPAWDRSDMLFIKVFRTIAITQRMIQDQPLSTVVATVLKKIGLYDEQAMKKTWPALTFDRFGAIVLLRDIGVLPEWQSIGLWDASLDIGRRYRAALDTKADLKPQASTGPLVKASGRSERRPMPPPNSMRVDPADVLRHDFADLPVYIIDDPNAEELDDGVSIQPIEDQKAWIHVHIADPTACLDPSDQIALQARQYLETLYLPGFTLPMLPLDFVRDNRLSLGVRAQGGGQRTLTFSALLDETGEILDHKIRPGFIRSTKQVTYDVVATVLDGKRPSPQPSLVIGTPVHPTESRSTLSLEELSEDDQWRLKQLGKYASILTRRRVNDGALGWNLPTPHVILQSRPAIPPVFDLSSSPQLLVGTPSVVVRLPGPIEDPSTHRWGISTAQQLVSEYMILAGRLVGRHRAETESTDCLLPFRTQGPPEIPLTIEGREALAVLRSQVSPLTGVVNPFVFTKAQVRFLPASHELTPAPHSPLGVMDEYGYCKVTSPLRRYGDLVTHWQLKSSLLRSQGKASYEDRLKILGSSRMNELMNRMRVETKPIQMLDRKMKASWMSYVMKRSELGELKAVILNEPVLMRFTNRWTVKVYLLELGIKASLVIKDPVSGFEEKEVIGGCVAVKVVYINQDDHVVVEVVKESRMGEMKRMA